MGSARRISRPEEGVESNSRLTAGAGALLLVLLAAEGVTILRVGRLLSIHVFVGMLLVPPVVLKMASTGWRFVRYYRGSPAYRHKGPPPILLRLLGPVVVVLTIVVLVSGILLVVAPTTFGDRMLTLHKVSFVLWFAAMTVHVLGHVVETARVAPADWARRTSRDVARTGARRWALVSSVVVGSLLGALMLGPTATYTNRHQFRGVSSRGAPVKFDPGRGPGSK